MRALLALTAIALSGCANNKPHKVCDEGRAIYYAGSQRGGVAVIDNAPECRK